VPKGFRSDVAYTHYSLLRTIESAWNLAPLTANDELPGAEALAHRGRGRAETRGDG